MADTYLKLHDGFPEHRKVVAVGGDAAWLHVCALAYASRNLSDGIVPEGMVSRLSDRKQPARLAAKLVQAGLWHKQGHDCERCAQPGAGEYVIHDYLVHQRSAEKVEELKAKRAASGSQGGQRKAANSRARAKPKPKQTTSNLLDGSYDAAVAKSYPDTEEVLRTSRTEEPLRGSRAETDVPPSAGAAAPRAALAPVAPATTDELIADWLDHVPKRPPGQVIGQVGKSVKTMLGEGIDPADVRRGIAAWSSKGLHPSVLPSVVNEVMNAGVARAAPSTDRRQQATDDMFAGALARAAAREEQLNDPDRSRDVVPIRPGLLPAAAHGQVHPGRVV